MASVNPYLAPSSDVDEAPIGLPDATDLVPPPSTLAKVLVVLLSVDMVCDLGATGFAVLMLQMMFRDGPGALAFLEAVPIEVLQAIDAFYKVSTLATVVVFCFWVARANKTARGLSPELVYESPGWAVGWFFIPIANLWKGYGVLSDIWVASDTSDPASRDGRLAWLKVWLLGWVLMIVSVLSPLLIPFGLGGFGSFITLMYGMIVGRGLGYFLACLGLILTVMAIQGAQARAYARGRATSDRR